MADSLRDQLLKRGLVSEQQARKLDHDKRVANAGKGPAPDAAAREAREQQTRAAEEAKRAADRERETARRSVEESRAAELRVVQMVEAGKVSVPARGPRRFYYLGREDRVPFIETTDEVAQRLERGALVVAESPTRAVTLIDAETAARVEALDPSWLRTPRVRSPG